MASLPSTPPATSEAARRSMQSNRRVDTAPELAIRRLLHGAGLRYRVDLPVETDARKVRPDVVFPRKRLALFVDGCFWHGCPAHCRLPTANRRYWAAKIDRNRRRDEETTAAMEREGWTVVRAWEHEDPAAVTKGVVSALEEMKD